MSPSLLVIKGITHIAVVRLYSQTPLGTMCGLWKQLETLEPPKIFHGSLLQNLKQTQKKTKTNQNLDISGRPLNRWKD